MLETFNKSMFARFFPNIETAEGQAFLQEVINYIDMCYGDVKDNCPNLYECFALNYMAYILTVWNVTFQEEGSEVVVPPVEATEPYLYLKQREVGGVSCTYEAWKPDCVDCGQTVVSKWKADWEKSLAMCQKACEGLPLMGGSNYPQIDRETCCNSHKIKKTCCN